MNMPIEDEVVIRCEHLSLHASSRTLLGGISLAIPRGAVVGLVGRNGSGKSTLLRSLVGLAAPDLGTIRLLGQAPLDMDDTVKAKLGYVAQTPDLFDWMTVEEHFSVIGASYPNWDPAFCELLRMRLDLPLTQRVDKLSGGDRQKLSVILALAHRPEVLILDEPVSNLDPLTRRDFMRALFIEPQQGEAASPTVIVSSHLLNDLERVVSHVAFLREGVLQLFDTWDAILEYVRLAPPNANAQGRAVIHRNHRYCVIDTRHDESWQGAGQPCTLDQLFAALNV